MLIESLAKYRIVEHEVLPCAAFDIDRALTQLLDGGGQLDRLLAAAPTLIDQPFDDEPALYSHPAEQQDDQHEAEQHALAEGNTVHLCTDLRTPIQFTGRQPLPGPGQ